jgi:hypothetical protein
VTQPYDFHDDNEDYLGAGSSSYDTPQAPSTNSLPRILIFMIGTLLLFWYGGLKNCSFSTLQTITQQRYAGPSNMRFAKAVTLATPSGTFSEEMETQNTNYLHLEKIYPTSFSLETVPATNLSGIPRNQIEEIRRQATQSIKQAFDIGYVPFKPVFDGIQDGRPWWGLEGITIYGPGAHAIQGDSYRSNSILNPLALIWPNVWDVTFPTNKMIDFGATIKNGKVDLAFPYLPTPKNIIVDPAKHNISMHIDTSAYPEKIKPYIHMLMTGQVLVQFEGVNARDLGYPFIAFDGAQSSNITKEKPDILAARDNEYYHTGSSCGYEGGCNNLSPKVDALSDYLITQLPAKAQFKLWHNKPGSFSDKAEITYTIYFD